MWRHFLSQSHFYKVKNVCLTQTKTDSVSGSPASSSMAVWPSCHPLLTPQEFLWSPTKTWASRTVIALQMSTLQEAMACPGTGALSGTVPDVLQKPLLCVAETLSGTAASLWMMSVIFFEVEKEERLQLFHMQCFSYCNTAHEINRFGLAFTWF